jgi:hypothetical protein
LAARTVLELDELSRDDALVAIAASLETAERFA